jgi:glutaryl-CoA dehydrogenase
MSRLLSSYRCAQRVAIRSTFPARVVYPCSTRLSRSYASASPISKFDWEDPLAAKNLLTEDELAISETAERYCQDHLLPRVLGTKHLLESLKVDSANF